MILNRTTTAILLALVMVAACDRRSATPDGSADTPVAADSIGATPTNAAVTSTAVAAPRDTTSTATKSKAGAPPIIGHDSAFGPIGTVGDTARKVAPIRRP